MVKSVGPARPRRRRLPDRHEVELPPQADREAGLPLRQRRRERARHLQGPRDHRARSAPAPRGHHHHGLRDRLPHGLHLHPRRVRARRQACSNQAIEEARAKGLPRQEHLRHRASTSTSSCTAAPAPTSAARRPASSSRSRASAPTRASSRRSRRRYGLFGCPTIVNNVETLACVPHIVSRGADWFKPHRAGEEPRPEALLRVAVTSSARGSTSCRWGRRCARSSTTHCGGIPNGRKLKAVIPGRRVGAGLHGRRDRRADGLRLGRQGGVAARLGGHHRHGRQHVHGAARSTSSAASIHHESCGQCTPCREGTGWLAQGAPPPRGGDRARSGRRPARSTSPTT